MRKKTIYIPIEIKAREFVSQVLLASKIGEAGGRVYLGGKSPLFRAIRTKPESGGTLLYKGGWPGAGFSQMKNHVSTIAVLDQEISPAWPDLRPGSRFDNDELNFVDRLYYANESFAESFLSDRPSVPADKVRVFGWPRVDLWNARYSAIWENQAERIRDRFGSFVLFSSDFDLLDADDVPWQLERMKVISSTPEKLADPKEAERYLYSTVQEFRSVIQFLQRLDQDPNFPPVVVRPHPAEDHSRWVSELQGMKKTSSVYEGDASAWVQASIAVLHRGCTNGLQAAVLGKPVGWIDFGSEFSNRGSSASRPLSKTIDGPPAAFALLEQVSEVNFPPVEHGLIGNTEGNASEMIAEDLLSLTAQTEKKLPTFWWFRGFPKALYSRLRPKLRRPLKPQRQNDVAGPAPRAVTKTNLKGGIRAGEVRDVIDLLGASDIIVKQVERNLVCIERRV